MLAFSVIKARLITNEKLTSFKPFKMKASRAIKTLQALNLGNYSEIPTKINICTRKLLSENYVKEFFVLIKFT